MGKIVKKKGESGKNAQYVSRSKALSKLQLSLRDFSKICIYKGIYPRSNNIVPKFHKKDVIFMAHDPLINVLRQNKIYNRRIKKATAHKDQPTLEKLENEKPHINLTHIIKERYPTFDHAMADLDDALSTIFTYACLPVTTRSPLDYIYKCRELSVYFMYYVILSRTLSKVFISVKGFYFQADIFNQKVTWLIPHNLMLKVPRTIDFKIMNTFIDLHTTLLGFVNFKLYHSLNLIYPPKIVKDQLTICPSEPDEFESFTEKFSQIMSINLDIGNFCTESTSQISKDLQTEEDKKLLQEIEIFDEHEKDKMAENQKFRSLFENCVFYLSRETPKEVLVFIIRSFGGTVYCENILNNEEKSKASHQSQSSSKDADQPQSFFINPSDQRITHHITDRPKILVQYPNRVYIQTQWLFDSVNSRMLLPVTDYVVGAKLPSHISPFEDKLTATFETALQTEPPTADLLEGEDISEQQNNGIASKSKSRAKNSSNKLDATISTNTDSGRFDHETKKLAVMSMAKKQRKIYEKVRASRNKELVELRKVAIRKQKMRKATKI